jgi:hypothetical protein
MSRMGDMMREAAEECVLDGLQKVLDDAGLAVDRVMLLVRNEVDGRCGPKARDSSMLAGVEDAMSGVKDRLTEAAWRLDLEER